MKGRNGERVSALRFIASYCLCFNAENAIIK